MTIDMTQNRVPYGLLDDEEKAAMHEHEQAGGKFEYYFDGVWSKCGPSWSTEGIYRTVPLPLTLTQDVIAWERLPAWVQWVERDEGGGVYATIDGPGSYFRRIDDFPGIVQIGTCDWKDSKQRRPRG
jgi:hypothetical protein